MMHIKNFRKLNSVLLLSALILIVGVGTAQAKVDGLEGVTTFNFSAKADHISTGEGNTVLFWGYADDDGHQGNMSGQAQYPGPTIIINAGETITVNLRMSFFRHIPRGGKKLKARWGGGQPRQLLNLLSFFYPAV